MSDPERGLPARITELQQQIAQLDPALLAARAGAAYHLPQSTRGADPPSPGELSLPLWGRDVRLPFPVGKPYWSDTGQPLGLLDQGLLAYYLSITDGTAPAGRWISFTELPDGRFYTRAFQGYTGQVLLRSFSDEIERFRQAALACQGKPDDLGDAAYAFKALPHVPILAVLWLGDEDFPSRYQILFDANIPHHLTTDGCAILGSALTRRLLKNI